MVIEIKRWDTTEVIFSSETAKDFKEAVEEAIKKGVNLYRANLMERDLTGCEFTECNLNRCDFSGSNLTGCKFSGCDITRCDFSECNLSGAYIFRCKMDKNVQDYLIKEWLKWEVNE